MPGETILVIEDNERNRKLVRVLLRAHRYQVLEASTAREALDILQETIPDLILTDIQLPETDGLALTRSLKARPALANTPIIALTAYAMKGDQEKILAAGCDGYVSKPIDTRKFPQLVQEYLAGSSQDA